MSHPDLPVWHRALERRQALPLPNGDRAMVRLLHTDGHGVRCDRYGPVCWFYWYRPHPPAAADLDAIASFTRAAGGREWLVHWMHDRGKDPHQRRRWSSSVPVCWQADEHGIRYRLKADQGLSPGLFLDQRPNRRWVLAHAAGKRVLNLFCYTGGFSLGAVRGKAASVTSVDTSKAVLDWTRENFALNQYSLDHTQFWPAEARFFLERCHKRGRAFDLIVCDPPSFARNKSGIFILERDLHTLVQQAWAVLSSGGCLLLSTNYEKWNYQTFLRAVEQALAGHCYTLATLPPPDGDFEAVGREAILKGTLIIKP